jgi:hypothetical protein
VIVGLILSVTIAKVNVGMAAFAGAAILVLTRSADVAKPSSECRGG